MLAYVRGLNPPRLVLWCYLLWYVVVLVRHFDPSPRLWLSSIGISAIIGTALYLSTAHAGAVRTTLDPWQVFRFYLMPFCVSSFAALIKDRGFVLVFHPTWEGNGIALAVCAVFLVVVAILKMSVGTERAVTD